MQHIDGEIVIHRPVDEVFDVVADGRNEPRYNPRMRRAEQISRGPIGRGTRFHCQIGRSVEITTEITAYERPRRLGVAAHSMMRLITLVPTMEMHGTLSFEPVPHGTRMRWSWEAQPRGVFRLLTPLVVRVGQRQETTIWTGLKQLLERPDIPLVAPT